MTAKRPNSRRNLDAAIQRAFGSGQAYVEARAIMANAIVGQMLPAGAIKGGSSLKLRYGMRKARFTTDLDAARAADVEAFSLALRERLAEGWEGFTGVLVVGRQAHPKDVPPAYVMQPFEVKLSYNEKPWVTVPLEVRHNELGDADEAEWGISPDIVEAFEAVGLPAPGLRRSCPFTIRLRRSFTGLPNLEAREPMILSTCS